jgi:hypothetical protein
VIVGVDNGTTYKIELDVLADAVTSRVNILDRDRLQSLESVTSSFEVKGRSLISSSAQITALGFTSSSTDLISLNSYTSSQSALNTAFTNGINARLTTSSFESFSSSVHSEILAATNEQDLTPYVTELVYGVLSQSVDSRIDNLELNSGSYLTSLNGAISSSSQLTSSFDGRYVVSGSITQTTWDNISGKPSGLVSQSTDLTSLNNFTASISTASLVNRLNAIENVSGSWITENETGSFLTNLNGAISSSNQLTESFDTRYTLSGSVQPLPNNLISSSAQITSLGFISSSDSITSLNSYTSSLKGAIELTGSTVSFLGNIVVYGTQSIISSQNVEISDNILYLSPTASTDNDLGIVGHYNDGTYRHAGIFMDASDGHSWKVFNGLQTETTATVDTSGTGFTLADFKAGVITGTSFNGVINASNGVISGSSQLTSSFDTRYAASGSSVSLPSGVISGSSQLTSSFATTGSNSFNGNQTITGSLIVSSVAVVNGGVTIPTGSTISLTSGSNLFVDSSGGITGSLSGSVFGIGDVVAFSSSVNTRINNIVSAPAGTISGSSQLTSSFDTRYTLSGSVQPLPSGVISGSSQLTSSLDTIYLTIGGDNVISGSSQLTASLDTRYAASGSGGSLPSGVISGSSQLTSSFDGRYLVTGSVTSSILQLNTFTASNANTSLNTFTSSLNVWSSSLATTGSNTFNGNQTITGSLNLTNGNIVASQITANTSSLYLTSGSNLYIQNTGLAEISGSLRVSGSLSLTGSISISSGSITMPNRPGFRVYGLGGATTSVTILSGSMTIVDYNQGGWDNTTGTFTAPITGLYQVNLVCRTNSNSSAQSVQVIVYKNYTGLGTGTAQVMVEWAANTTTNHIGASTISKLAVGDTLKAIVTVGTASFDVNDNFSVAYIG